MADATPAQSGSSLPSRFLEVRVSDLASHPTLRAACVGYESGEWRDKQLASHLMEWLPDFALDPIEAQGLASHNAVALLRRAAHNVYTSDKYARRGEFGEILLHVLLRQDCGTEPAISKVYFKDASNETVKGFDAVHVVGEPDDLELWLGEAKFYNNRASAIRDITSEVEEHLKKDYLRSEFLAITAKLDPEHPHTEALRRLLDPNTSLDQVFTRLCIPMLITYDSECVTGHTAVDCAYETAFEEEAREGFEALIAKLANHTVPEHVRLHALLVPLKCKATLVQIMDEELKRWQTNS